MPTFHYTASQKDGKILKGEMQAQKKEVVLKFLQNRGFLVLSILEQKKKSLFVFSRLRRISSQDKITAIENLATMIKAGVPLTETFDILIADTQNLKLRDIFQEVKASLEQGSSLSSALGQFPEEFSEIFLNVIKTGEESGRLYESLFYLVTSLKKDQELKTKIRNALIYPAVLLLGAALVVTLLLTFVLPRLVQVFSDLGVDLPLPTKILLFVANLFSKNKIITISSLLILLGFFSYILNLSKVRKFLFKILFYFPFVKNLLKEVELASLCRTLSTLLSSGVSIIKALQLAASASSSAKFAQALKFSKDEVEKGVALGNVLRKYPSLFPRLLVSMVDAGEKSGKLDELLSELAQFYEEKVENTLKNLTVLIEPILLLLVGLIIGGIALSIILPIYQLFGSI